jgi:hypothetical protein
MRITPQANGDEPAHWRRCAEEARRASRQTRDPLSKKTLAEIADAYEQLAALAKARLAGEK